MNRDGLAIGLVCFRLRPDIIGGAERFVMRLGAEFSLLGHDVSYFTTTATRLSQPDRWRVAWEQAADSGTGHLTFDAGPVGLVTLPVERRPIRPALPRAGFGRRLQESWEEEQQIKVDAWIRAAEAGDASLAGLYMDEGKPPLPLLGPGWQLPEFHAGKCTRWTSKRAAILIPPQLGSGTLEVWGTARSSGKLRLECNSSKSKTHSERRIERGQFSFSVEIAHEEKSGGVWTIEWPQASRPASETRVLGLSVEGAAWRSDTSVPEGEIALHETFTDAQEARPVSHRMSFPPSFERRRQRAAEWFDRARGPNVPGLARSFPRYAAGRDALVVAGMPFASFNWPRLHLAGKGTPWFSLPFRHAGDPYYDWPSYENTLRSASGILTLTRSELNGLPDELRRKQSLIGAGVDLEEEPSWASPDERTAARRQLGLPEDSLLVLSLGRKSPTKGYLEVLDGVRHANARDSSPAKVAPPFVLVMAGPDEDGISLRGPESILLGAVDEPTKRQLFRACDLMAFFSQSESFGMVMLEAWASGCLVLAGKGCASAADVADRLGAPTAANNPPRIADALIEWRSLPEVEKRERWSRGLEAIRARFTWRAVAERAVEAIDKGLS